MSGLENSIKKLETNGDDVYQEAIRLLLKIIDNVIKDPSNKRVRSLQKNNATVSNKILSVKGGLECLKSVGFVENGSSFLLPDNVSEEHLKYVRDVLGKRKKGESVNLFSNLLLKDEVQECKTGSQMFTHPFLNKIERVFHQVLAYEDKALQSRAVKYIPVVALEMKAEERLRSFQESLKKSKSSDLEVSLQDMLILELLSWFKGSFFTWVDSPDCSTCGGKTKMSHMSEDSNLLVYTDRVEMHLCETCQSYTPFPRYNDLNILLETRKGRCGEWANVFTLFCRTMCWDARYVLDETDHVWTEVYSCAQKRWLHCDPCENACDTPLIYESGWKKKLSYVIAYSAEEVQDVTWRYSSCHKELLQRRNKCGEMELIDALVKLREERQKRLSEAKRLYLTKRLLMELVELMQERKPGDNEKQGRSSGSLLWRLNRGETHLEENASFTWLITEEDVADDSVTIRYSSSLDQYELISGEKRKLKKKWNLGLFEQKGVFRKEETDWKMVYLARKEGENEGVMKWKFSIEIPKKVINEIDVLLDHTTYENGKVDTCIKSSEIMFPLESTKVRTKAFEGSKSIEIMTRLSGGKGDVAWQHAQLFRQSLDSSDYKFSLSITFKNEM